MPILPKLDSFKAIQEHYKTVLAEAHQQKKWYIDKSVNKKKWSKAIRILAIAMIGIGSICPLIEATDVIHSFNLGQWGYVGFAIAAIFIGFDRFFGMSSGWIRYRLTIMSIDRTITEFEYSWTTRMTKLGDRELSDEQLIELTTSLQDFVLKITDVIRHETENWAREFETNLAELQRIVKTEVEIRKVGNIELTLTNSEIYGDLIIFLNGSEQKSVKGSKSLISNLNPGAYEVTVQGKHKTTGKTIIETEIAQVAADDRTTVHIILPQ